jgi:sulfite exporter TauE/SafE
MDWALILSAMLLGLAGTPHCAAMCGAACTAFTGSGRQADRVSFHLARAAGYTIAGAVVASSVGLLAQLGQASAALKPLWTLVHVAALVLGLWLLWFGRQPAWMENLGRRGTRPSTPVLSAGAAGGWQRMQGPVRAGTAGALWVGWPCGLLQSALVVAALANTATAGAMVMLGFALVTGAGLAVGPWLWTRVMGAAPGGASGAVGAAWATRMAGVVLAAASSWALGHGLWQQVAAFCGF